MNMKNISLIILILFISFIITNTKTLSEEEDEREVYDLEEQRRIYNFDLIKDNPHLFKKYFL